ncbi:MAG: glutamyl-tRNA reductase [Eubacterium sp.]|nr:glutamyl-tRNA reductase [Eubacterium sp.]
MSISLVYLDYKSADIAVREKFSFTSSRIREILWNIRRNEEISGCVLLSTCNRTELYISGPEIIDEKLCELLCRQAGVNDEKISGLLNIKRDKEAMLHLMEVACGLQSMVLYEDQILAQVKNAAETAREEGAADSMLETLFRLGITAAKKAKTQVKIRAVPNSAADKAITVLSERYRFAGRKALVIGNGEIGRACCKRLMELGVQVTVTLRSYRHGEVVVPEGCNTIQYAEREQFLEKADVVISATASPHFTITCDMVKKLEKQPGLFVDLALPRDIEPGVGDLPGISCYNLDMFYTDYSGINRNEINEIKEIIDHYMLQYEKWSSFHKINSFTEKVSSIKINC